ASMSLALALPEHVTPVGDTKAVPPAPALATPFSWLPTFTITSPPSLALEDALLSLHEATLTQAKASEKPPFPRPTALVLLWVHETVLSHASATTGPVPLAVERPELSLHDAAV